MELLEFSVEFKCANGIGGKRQFVLVRRWVEDRASARRSPPVSAMIDSTLKISEQLGFVSELGGSRRLTGSPCVSLLHARLREDPDRHHHENGRDHGDVEKSVRTGEPLQYARTA